jgi:hypothetical protein
MKAGELYRFPDGWGHCHHGLLRVYETSHGLRLIDTYWGSIGDGTAWKPEEVSGKIEFILDLSSARFVRREEFEQYLEKDRAHIPVGGGAEQFWVSQGASPDPQLIENQLRAKVDEAERAIKAATWNLRHTSIRLGEFLKERKGTA